jgi:hypothetical protein
MTTIEYDKFNVSARFQDNSLHRYQYLLLGPPSFFIGIVNGYNGADNFGQGIHTYSASGIGWQLVGWSGFFSPRYLPHAISFEITYEIRASDLSE